MQYKQPIIYQQLSVLSCIVFLLLTIVLGIFSFYILRWGNTSNFILIIFVFRSHEQQSNGYDWRQDTPFWNNGVKSSRTGTSGQSSNKPQVPGNKPNLREEPWTHLHGPASLWPAGQHGYPPGLFFGRKAGVPGGANAGKYVNFNQ